MLDDNAAALEAIDRELCIEQVPEDEEISRDRVRFFLTETTLDWFAEFRQYDFGNYFGEELASQLADKWLACLSIFDGAFDLWIESEILSSGQHCLSGWGC